MEQPLVTPVQPSVDIAETVEGLLRMGWKEALLQKETAFWFEFVVFLDALTSIISFFQCSALFYCFGGNGCEATLLHLIW